MNDKILRMAEKKILATSQNPVEWDFEIDDTDKPWEASETNESSESDDSESSFVLNPSEEDDRMEDETAFEEYYKQKKKERRALKKYLMFWKGILKVLMDEIGEDHEIVKEHCKMLKFREIEYKMWASKPNQKI